MKLQVVVLAAIFTASTTVEFQFLNYGQDPIWVIIQETPGNAKLSGGRFVLQSRQKVSITAADNWAGRFWPQIWSISETGHYNTDRCGNKVQCNGTEKAFPVSIAEIILQGYIGLDFYRVTLENGFNTMIAIEPLHGQGDNGSYSCKQAACDKPLNDNCPNILRLRNNKGKAIGCMSACNAFNTDEYCCRGAFNSPKACKPSTWRENFSKYFKNNCPHAFSYTYDNKKTTFTCKASTYLITFGG